MNVLALFISTLFEPMIVAYVLAITAGIHAGLMGSILVWYVVYASVLFGIVLFARRYFQSRDKTNWDITDRKKRITPLIVLILLLVSQVVAVRALGSAMVTSLFWLFVSWVIGFFLITLKVKISGHVGIMTFAICIFYLWYGTRIMPLFLLPLFLSWSRIWLKRHTVLEVVLGMCYSIGVFLLSTI